MLGVWLRRSGWLVYAQQKKANQTGRKVQERCGLQGICCCIGSAVLLLCEEEGRYVVLGVWLWRSGWLVYAQQKKANLTG